MSDPKEWKPGPETDLAVEQEFSFHKSKAKKAKRRYSTDMAAALWALAFYEDFWACREISLSRDFTFVDDEDEASLIKDVTFTVRASGVTGRYNPKAKHVEWEAEGTASTAEDEVRGINEARSLAICRMILNVADDEDDAET